MGAIYGYSHTAGGYDGRQAEYVCMPMADIGLAVLPARLDLAELCCCPRPISTATKRPKWATLKRETGLVFGAKSRHLRRQVGWAETAQSWWTKLTTAWSSSKTLPSATSSTSRKDKATSFL